MRYAPLLIHHFALCAPRKILDATQFQQRYHRYEEIENVPDRLRWHRYIKGWMQKDVAQKIGISKRAYSNLENGNVRYISKETADRLSELYNVPATNFLDEYSRFLYDGQAVRIRAYRASIGMNKRELGVPIRCLQTWENEQKIISRKSWEYYFKNKLQEKGRR